MYNNDAPSEAQKEQLYEVLRWAVSRGMTATFHWHKRPSRCIICSRCWSASTPRRRSRRCVGRSRISTMLRRKACERMKSIGLGWFIQNAFYFRGEAFLGQRGPEDARIVPPIVSAVRIGIPSVAARRAPGDVTSSPFVSLQWMLDGRTVGGIADAGPEESSRTRSRRCVSIPQGSAWFTFEEGDRGALAVGKLADLAVLSKPVTVPRRRPRDRPRAGGVLRPRGADAAARLDQPRQGPAQPGARRRRDPVDDGRRAERDWRPRSSTRCDGISARWSSRRRCPRSVRLAEAPSHGLPVISYDRRSSGAQAYWKVAMELVDRR